MKLEEIKSPADLKQIPESELPQLCDELRKVLLEKLSHHGGHTGPNLGFLEATVALHYVFDAPKDKIVFDVSHQTYVHKMLTGRIDAFLYPDKYDYVTGYTNPEESPYDLFAIGHTSTSIALADGLAKARDIIGGDENVVAVIGDGSLSGGEAFEGLDSAAERDSNFIVIINDNDQSIAENHGGLYRNLAELRSTDGNAECNFFKVLGLDYTYVAYGNDVIALVEAFRKVKDIKHPIVVHVNTQKGKGYAPAETHKEAWHFTAPFDIPTGQSLNIDNSESYDEIFAAHMLERIKRNPKTVVMTAGTPGVLGFTPELRREAGQNFIDVGIAEQDAVGMGSGLAKGGAVPVFGVVSSFLQRTYDQLSQDVGINKQPLVVNIFYGSVAGMNDMTHLGWFDIPLVSNIPNWIFMAPTCAEEYLRMLDWAMTQRQHPVAVRVPGFGVKHSDRPFPCDYSSEINKFEMVKQGKDVAIIAAGGMFWLGEEVADALNKEGIEITLINPRFLSGLDTEMLNTLKSDHMMVMTLEDGCLDGGFGEKVARYYGPSEMRTECYGLPKKFEDRYKLKEVLKTAGLTADQLVSRIKKIIL
ncbi:MAG: 1-deoxy-D-xylulose-5-phosphate synthase [Clostridium sp.]|nr:1-deoxy-D-xylulose-5-phosphate synthase [Prevotella sp.]MCM1429344.1 1-deoxy-D-xylulose-5-phosphate synthase [Clostridium sp.]